MANGPVPSRLTFLTNLPFHAPGVKVRFLGCVQSYHPPSATLTLAHDFPRGSAARLRAAVDTRLVSDSLSPETVRVGEWVNVVGYVGGKRLTAPSSPKQTLPTSQVTDDLHNQHVEVCVDALALWSAGPLDLGEYERSLVQQDIEQLERDEEEAPSDDDDHNGHGANGHANGGVNGYANGVDKEHGGRARSGRA